MSINSSGAVSKMKSVASGGAQAGVAAKTSNPGKADSGSGDSVGNGKPGVPAQGEMHFSGSGASELG